MSDRTEPGPRSGASRRPPTDDAATGRVLLLLESERDRERLAERLAAHEVVVGEPAADEPLPRFDCCLVDTATYPGVADELAARTAESDLFLPVLLVVGPDEGTVPSRTLSEVDDLLSLPVDERVLRSRVGSMLRARRNARQLDAERERFRTLAETAPSAILTIDAEGIVRYANRAVASVFGYAPEEVTGEPLTMLMPPGLQEAHASGLAAYLETGERSLDWSGARLPGRHADGHELSLLVSFAEHDIAGERRFTGVVQDISERLDRDRELERQALSAGWESPLRHATGLGLWFVQWTATNSGGSLTIDDREGGGTVAELRLPAAEGTDGQREERM